MSVLFFINSSNASKLSNWGKKGHFSRHAVEVREQIRRKMKSYLRLRGINVTLEKSKVLEGDNFQILIFGTLRKGDQNLLLNNPLSPRHLKTADKKYTRKTCPLLYEPRQTQTESRAWGRPDRCGWRWGRRDHSGRCPGWSLVGWRPQSASRRSLQAGPLEPSSSRSKRESSFRRGWLEEEIEVRWARKVRGLDGGRTNKGPHQIESPLRESMGSRFSSR